MPGVSIQTIPYPLVNGKRQSFCSLEFKLNGLAVIGITSLNYKWSVKREKMVGTHPDPLGATRGQADYTCEAEFGLSEYNILIATAGRGFAESSGTITATYSETGLDMISDTIQIAGWEEGDASQSNDAKAITRKVSFTCMKIWPNGFDLWDNPLQAIAGAGIAAAVGGLGGI